MKDRKSRNFNGILYTGLGLFLAFFTYGICQEFGKGVWFLWLGVALLFFQGILSFVSAANRKKHDYYFNSNFDLDKINELNKNLNIIDKLIKFSPLVFTIIVGGWMFVATDYDFYTLFILGLYIILYWRGK